MRKNDMSKIEMATISKHELTERRQQNAIKVKSGGRGVVVSSARTSMMKRAITALLQPLRPKGAIIDGIKEIPTKENCSLVYVSHNAGLDCDSLLFGQTAFKMNVVALPDLSLPPSATIESERMSVAEAVRRAVAEAGISWT